MPPSRRTRLAGGTAAGVGLAVPVLLDRWPDIPATEDTVRPYAVRPRAATPAS